MKNSNLKCKYQQQHAFEFKIISNSEVNVIASLQVNIYLKNKLIQSNKQTNIVRKKNKNFK